MFPASKKVALSWRCGSVVFINRILPYFFCVIICWKNGLHHLTNRTPISKHQAKYLPQFFYSLLVPVTLFIFMSFISIKAAIVFILCVPLIPISIIAIMKIAKKILKDYWKSYSDLGGTFLENLQGLTTLKVFNVDEERHKKMNEEAENFRKITMKVLSMQLNSITIMDLVAFLGSALGSIVALIQYKNGQLQVGHLIIIILLSSEFFIPLRLLGSYFHIAMNGMAASDRIFNILDSKEREKKKSSFKNGVKLKFHLIM